MFATAFVKFYIISCCVLTSVSYTNVQNPGSISGSQTNCKTFDCIFIAFDLEQYNTNRLLTLCLGMLLTGNIMDNMAGYERQVTVCLDVMLSIAFFFWGLAKRSIPLNDQTTAE